MEKPLIEERAKVVAIEGDQLVLETIRQSACQACQAQKDCGHHKLLSWQESIQQSIKDKVESRSTAAQDNQFKVFRPIGSESHLDIQVGDEVMIGVPDGAIIKSSAMVYGLPLLGMIGGAMIGQLLNFSEPKSIFLSFLGLGLGFIYLKRKDKGLSKARLSIFTPIFVSKIRNQ